MPHVPWPTTVWASGCERTLPGKSGSSPQAEDHPASGPTETSPPRTRTRDRANRDLQSIRLGSAGFGTTGSNFAEITSVVERFGIGEAVRQWTQARGLPGDRSSWQQAGEG